MGAPAASSRIARWIAAGAAALGFLAADLIALAPRADAAHHLVRIRQVFAGFSTSGNASAEFAVLQLTSAGENQLTGATVKFYGPALLENSGTFTGAVGSGANQQAILVATTATESSFGVQADLELPTADTLTNGAGAVCIYSGLFPDVDCVEWGTGEVDTLPSATEPLEPVIPGNNMIERTIVRGCQTALDAADDTNDSAADFFPVGPIDNMTFNPRNSGNAIPETECAATSPPGGGGGGSMTPATPVVTPTPTTPPKKCKKGQKLKKGKCVKKKRKKP